MANIVAETFKSRIYSGGAHGNLSVAFGRAVLNGAAIADVVYMLDVGIGIKFVGLRLGSVSGLGAGVTVTVDVGDNTLVSSVDASSAFAIESVFLPVYITDKSSLTVTIEGAVATGDIEVIPMYVAEGY